MKKTLLTILATVVGTIAVLAAGLYAYVYFTTQKLGEYAEVMMAYSEQWQAKDYAAAERTLLDGLASEALAEPQYQLFLRAILADFYQSHHRDVAAAEKQYRAALAIEVDENIPAVPYTRSELLLSYARLLDDSGRYDEAIERFQEALRISLGPSDIDPLRETRIFMALGIAHVHRKDFDRGEYYLEETRKRAEAQSPPNFELKILAYNNLAWMYQRSAKYDKASEAAGQGIRIAEVIGDKQLLATMYDTQAQILLALKRYEEALSYSEKSLSPLPDTDYMSAVHYRTHGAILAAIDRKAEGCESLVKAQEFYAKAANEKERVATREQAAALAC